MNKKRVAGFVFLGLVITILVLSATFGGHFTRFSNLILLVLVAVGTILVSIKDKPREIVTSLTVQPINGARALVVTKINSMYVELTAVFSTGLESKAILTWEAVWNLAFMEAGIQDMVGSGLVKVIKEVPTESWAESTLAFFFTPVKHFDQIVVTAKDFVKVLTTIQ